MEAGPGVNGNQGHYIQFFINQQDRSTLEVGARRGDPTAEIGSTLTEEYALARKNNLRNSFISNNFCEIFDTISY